MGPNHMAFGPDGNLYLTEFRGGRLFKLAPDGSVLAQWAGDGEAPGQLGAPTGIYVASDGFIYVGESRNSRVQKFSPQGESVIVWGERGRETGQFLSAMGTLVIDQRVYSADFGNNRVQVFTTDGEYLFSFGESGREDGQFTSPIGVDRDVDGNVYVVDAGNFRVQKFSADGEPSPHLTPVYRAAMWRRRSYRWILRAFSISATPVTAWSSPLTWKGRAWPRCRWLDCGARMTRRSRRMVRGCMSPTPATIS